MTRIHALSVNFGQGFTDAWSAVARFVPKFIGFLAILVIGWFVARILAKVVDTVLRRVGFERLVERSGMGRMLSGSKYDATAILAKVVYYLILLIALQLGFGVFGSNPISHMISGIVAWIPRAIVALVIVVVATAIARAVRDIITNALSGLSYGNLLGTIAWAAIIALGVIAALGQAGIATAITGPMLIAALATIGGILVVGVGGGMVTPMRQRWDSWLATVERETGKAKESMTAYQQGRAAAAGQDVSSRERSASGGMRPGASGSGPGSGGMSRPASGSGGMGPDPNRPGNPDGGSMR